MEIVKEFTIVDWVHITSQFKEHKLYADLMKCSYCLFQRKIIVLATTDYYADRFNRVFADAINRELEHSKSKYRVIFAGPGVKLVRVNWLHVAIGVFAFIALVAFALNHRYIVDGVMVFDKWIGDFIF